MPMLLRIAWRNIWRNKLRSSVVIVSITLGLWAAAFLLAYMFGIIEQRLNSAISNEISHIQLHKPDYMEDKELKYYMADADLDIPALNAIETIEASSLRTIVYGMVSSANASQGAKIIGIDIEDENAVTGMKDHITEGNFLTYKDRNKVVLGRKLADKLKLRVGSKLVLNFQDLNNDIVAAAFRIAGIYELTNKSIESNNIYINKPELQKLLNIPASSHEIAILLKRSEDVDASSMTLQKRYPDLLVQKWSEISPELGLMVNSLDQYMIIFLVIILAALSFGIVNTMLMSVLERVKEIGVLMSIGMTKKKVFAMVFLETCLIVGISAPIGLFLAWASILYLGNTGIDISSFAKDAYASFGIDTVIYPELDTVYYWRILIMVGLTAILASLYPSYTAIKLDPVKAIRKI